MQISFQMLYPYKLNNFKLQGIQLLDSFDMKQNKLGLSWAKLSQIEIEIDLIEVGKLIKLLRFIQMNSLS